MSEQLKDGGPAFPTQTYDRDAAHNGIGVTVTDAPGMSLRDWFAGKALAGMLADPNLTGQPQRWAKLSYEVADAMLEARK